MSLQVSIRKDEDKKVSIMQLYLQESDYGFVYLYGVDGHGNNYIICDFSEHGIKRWINIPEETGWPLDSNGRLKWGE